MSDQEIGKRESETIDLYPFLEAYEWVTGENLSIVYSGDNPDFICRRPNGEETGVELTKVMRDPRDAQWERIIEKIYEMDPYDAQAIIFELIEKKETARSRHYVHRVNETILVLQLVDCSLSTMMFTLENLQNDFTTHGFSEIWLADYTGLEAYGDIELFGLFPVRWWGYHERPKPYSKPYG